MATLNALEAVISLSRKRPAVAVKLALTIKKLSSLRIAFTTIVGVNALVISTLVLLNIVRVVDKVAVDDQELYPSTTIPPGIRSAIQLSVISVDRSAKEFFSLSPIVVCVNAEVKSMLVERVLDAVAMVVKAEDKSASPG